MRLTRRVPLKEQEQLYLPEHLSFSGVRVTRSLVSCVHFVDRFVCPFSFDHCVSSIYGFGYRFGIFKLFLIVRFLLLIDLAAHDLFHCYWWEICVHYNPLFLHLCRSQEEFEDTKDTRTPLKPGVNSGAPEGWVDVCLPLPIIWEMIIVFIWRRKKIQLCVNSTASCWGFFRVFKRGNHSYVQPTIAGC